MLNAPITIGAKTLSSDVIEAGLKMMTGTFDNMDVAAAFGRAGFEKGDLWIRQEAANRLLQKARKAGLVTFEKKKWHAAAGA